jgi:hypothetical protein
VRKTHVGAGGPSRLARADTCRAVLLCTAPSDPTDLRGYWMVDKVVLHVGLTYLAWPHTGEVV